MPTYFKGLALGAHSAKDIERAFKLGLAGNHLMFGLKWTATRHLLLYMLHVRVVGKRWHNVLKNTVPDTDGELVIPLGSSPPGAKLEVAFGIMAATAIPKCFAFIGETQPPKAIQVAPLPVGTTKPLKATETWEEIIKYTMQ